MSLDGTEYEIDLNAKHSEELHAALANYVAHSRKERGRVPAAILAKYQAAAGA